MKRKSPSRKSVPKPRKEDAGNPISKSSGPNGNPTPEEPHPSAAAGAWFWLMPALSGFACLIYQILWMRELGLLLGNTSQAAALTLAVFFGGLSIGGWYWGERCQKKPSPLRTYAWLELGIAAAGTVLLIAPAVVPHVYPMLHQEGLALTAFKFISTLLL